MLIVRGCFNVSICICIWDPLIHLKKLNSSMVVEEYPSKRE